MSSNLTASTMNTIRSGKELGFASKNLHIWHTCEDCGKERWVVLRRGVPRHLKCYSCNGNSRPGTLNPCYRHGDAVRDSRAKLYMVWSAMKERCGNPNHRKYDRYGGRGIGVCDEWQEDYTSFKNWASGSGYEEGLSIDRVDNDGNYEPNNCQWIPVSENVRKRFE